MSSAALNDQSVQATMLMPLWGRAKYSSANPHILNDEAAIKIIETCGVDFSGIEQVTGDFSGITYLARARKMEDAVRHYISKHPNATVVNIGAGLDTTFSRIDNGSIHYYSLDLPDSIAFRQQFITDSPRSQCIAKSFLDFSWFDDIKYRKEDGIILFSGGVFFYFQEEQIRQFLCALTKRFPGGEIIFDTICSMGIRKSKQMVQKSGNHGAVMHFSVDKPDKFEQWSPQLRLLSFDPVFKGIKAGKHWRFAVRMAAWFFSHGNGMCTAHLRFNND